MAHQLIVLDKISDLYSGQKAECFSAFRTSGIRFPREFAKFEPNSVSELYGYLIAQHIGVRVPRFQGFVLSSGGELCSEIFFPNRIGVLTESLELGCDGGRIGWLQSTEEDRMQIANALVLSAFGLMDVAEVFRDSLGKIVFIDLDLQGVFCEIPETMPGTVRKLHIRGLKNTILNCAETSYKRSVSLGVSQMWLEKMKTVVNSGLPDLNISGHPEESFLNYCSKTRIKIIYRQLKNWIFNSPPRG